jgi:hypothetical protein
MSIVSILIDLLRQIYSTSKMYLNVLFIPQILSHYFLAFRQTPSAHLRNFRYTPAELPLHTCGTSAAHLQNFRGTPAEFPRHTV